MANGWSADAGAAGSLARQVAIVTGGTVGIGRAIGRSLAEAGAHVVVVGRTLQRVNEAVDEFARRGRTPALGLALDVRRESDMEEMARRTIGEFGQIDILVAAAGILRAPGSSLKTLVQMSAEEWNAVLDTNLKGVFLANRAVLPAMIDRRSGQILNLSSTSGRKGYAFDSAYCASKFGVIGLSEAVAHEARPFGIRVQVLLPGAIDTPMRHQNGPLRRPDYALPVERVADLAVYMLALPDDTVLLSPSIEPLQMPLRTGWIGRTSDPGQVIPHGSTPSSTSGRGDGP